MLLPLPLYLSLSPSLPLPFPATTPLPLCVHPCPSLLLQVRVHAVKVLCSLIHSLLQGCGKQCTMTASSGVPHCGLRIDYLSRQASLTPLPPWLPLHPFPNPSSSTSVTPSLCFYVSPPASLKIYPNTHIGCPSLSMPWLRQLQPARAQRWAVAGTGTTMRHTQIEQFGQYCLSYERVSRLWLMQPLTLGLITAAAC